MAVVWSLMAVHSPSFSIDARPSRLNRLHRPHRARGTASETVLSPADPVSYVLVALVLGASALIATAIPVRRALRVDPTATLKAD